MNALDLIYRIVDETNGQRHPENHLAKAEDAVLVGEGGVLDSLGIINFLLAVEQAAAREMDVHVNLIDESVLSLPDGPLQTLGKLSSFLESQRRASV